MAETKTKKEAQTQENEESFEKSLEALEALVQSLEQGELSLEEAMSAYEQGVKLTTRLNHRLKAAKLKVEELKGQKNEA